MGPRGEESTATDTADSAAHSSVDPAGTIDESVLGDAPTQPSSVESFPIQILAKRTLSFQPSWYDKFPWLHVPHDAKGVICFVCAKALQLNLLELSTKADDAFLSKGFCNWKKAIDRFKGHEKSAVHLHAASQLAQRRLAPIEAQLSQQKAAEQQKCRIALMKLLSSVRYLLRQGLALRGHSSHAGNYAELVKLRCDDSNELRAFVNKITNYMSPEPQNEMIRLLSHGVLDKITQTIKATQYFAIVVDGTQDCTGIEQESICIRYVAHDLEPHEVFVGLYQPSDTKGATIAAVIEDALVRLDLPLNDLRGQTYDGAANMAGEYNGCQAIISQKQPLALYMHCGAHCSNLVMESAAIACPLVRDAISCVHELGVVLSRSGKLKAVFVGTADDLVGHFATIKPLCPTRWLCRGTALQRVITQYEVLLRSLEEIAASHSVSEAATKARGLLHRFQDGTLLLGIRVALSVFPVLEELNRALQARDATVGGMLQAVDAVKLQLSQVRSDEQFTALFTEVNATVAQLDLKTISLPRQRRPPSRYSGAGSSHVAASAEQHYKAEYFQFIDAALVQLGVRFDPAESSGITRYLALEQVLTSGESNDNDVISSYPELDATRLAVQLGMFKLQFNSD